MSIPKFFERKRAHVAVWDPIRDVLRFKALLAKLAVDEKKAAR